MSVSTSTKMMWAYQAAEGTNPITANNSLAWKFGAYLYPYSLPVETHEWQAVYTDGRDPQSINLAKTFVASTIGFAPSNAIPWYWALGAEAANVITGIDTGNLPILALRWEDTGGTQSIYHTALDNRLQTLAFTVDLNQQAGSPFAMGATFLGRSVDDTTLQAAHNGAVYPTDDYLLAGAQKDDLYRHSDALSLTWDYGGDGIAMKSVLSNLAITVTNTLNPLAIQNQASIDKIWEGRRIITASWNWKRGLDTSMIDDFYDDDKYDMRFVVKNGSTYNIIVDLADVAIQNPVANSPLYQQGELPAWDVRALVRTCTVTKNDGVSASFYP